MSRAKKVRKTLQKYGAQSLERLMQLAEEGDTPPKLRAEIYRWFAEMEFGKPGGKSGGEPAEDEACLTGELEKWSE